MGAGMLNAFLLFYNQTLSLIMSEKPNNLPIKSWATEDRPREKMLLKGLSSLSEAELLAILIGSGNKNESAVQLAQRILLRANNNLNSLGKLSVNDLISEFNGIGEAKAVTICAAMELGKRRVASQTHQRPIVRCSNDGYQLFHPLLCDLPHEELWLALMNRSAKVIDRVKISQGGTGETTADIQLMLKAAVTNLATGLILCHNHPSGNSAPSLSDDRLTYKLYKSARLMDISLLDHIIVCDESYYSYADEGRLIPPGDCD